MAQEFTGGCLCGAIRYQSDEPPKTSWLCHCRDCQKAHSSSFFPAMMFLKASLHVEGTPKGYTVTADSGTKIAREFCGACGSTLFTRPENYPDLIVAAAGTLDDPSIYQPKAHAFAGSEWDWAKIDDGLDRFPGQVTKR